MGKLLILKPKETHPIELRKEIFYTAPEVVQIIHRLGFETFQQSQLTDMKARKMIKPTSRFRSRHDNYYCPLDILQIAIILDMRRSGIIIRRLPIKHKDISSSLRLAIALGYSDIEIHSGVGPLSVAYNFNWLERKLHAIGIDIEMEIEAEDEPKGKYERRRTTKDDSPSAA